MAKRPPTPSKRSGHRDDHRAGAGHRATRGHGHRAGHDHSHSHKLPGPSRQTDSPLVAFAKTVKTAQRQRPADVKIGANGQAYPPSRIAHLQRGRQLPLVPSTRPKLTRDRADQFVKMVMAGVPPIKALAFFDPEYARSSRPEGMQRWLLEWQADPLMDAAVERFNEGKWQDLDKDQRLQLVIDKHLAEMAYFLFTHNFNALFGEDLRKAEAARQSIQEAIAAAEGNSGTSAYEDVLRKIASGALTGVSQVPPEIKIDPPIATTPATTLVDDPGGTH